MTFQELEEAVASYAARAAEKMRRQALATAHVAVFLETNSFKPTDPQYHVTRAMRLPVASADAGTVGKAVARVLRTIWKDGYPLRKSRASSACINPTSRSAAYDIAAPM